MLVFVKQNCLGISTVSNIDLSIIDKDRYSTSSHISDLTMRLDNDALLVYVFIEIILKFLIGLFERLDYKFRNLLFLRIFIQLFHQYLIKDFNQIERAVFSQ